MKGIIEEKSTNIEALSTKFAAIRNLVCRNSQLRPPKNIRFPFFVIEPSEASHTELGIKMQADLRKMLINSNRGLKIYGDLEVLSEIPAIIGAKAVPSTERS